MQLLTIDQIAERLGFSPVTIAHWAYGHRRAPENFPAPIHVGRQLRFVAADIDAWISALRGVTDTVSESPRRRGRARKSMPRNGYEGAPFSATGN
ncbi:hypothetical protein B1A_09526 [mine drainage metagenome]|uniref:Helix-turn-helix domain-containing protein n=1 Tax=mine drainage metagenome TaxID=410659 RepID=T1AMX7_9ZZZZ